MKPLHYIEFDVTLSKQFTPKSMTVDFGLSIYPSYYAIIFTAYITIMQNSHKNIIVLNKLFGILITR